MSKPNSTSRLLRRRTEDGALAVVVYGQSNNELMPRNQGFLPAGIDLFG